MLKPELQNKITNYVLVVLSLALVIVAVLRAINIPLTHDEAVTCSLFVPKNVFDILGYVESYGMPNNHIINTLLIKFSTFVLGTSTLAIRLPNLLGLVLFLYAASRLLKELHTPVLTIAGFILLTCNPYTFDFFCLARGYGIANACMMMMLWKLHSWMKQPQERTLVSMLVFGGLMVLSNFTTFHLFMGLLGLVTIISLKNRTTHSIFKTIRTPLLVFVILGILLYEPFRCILKWKTTYGGTTGFWSDCVLPLVTSGSYNAHYESFAISTASILIPVLLGVIAVALFLLWKRNRFTFTHSVAVLLAANVLLLQLQHLILGSEFPVARAIQFIFPLFIVLMLFSFNVTGWLQKTGKLVLPLMAILAIALFAVSIKPGYVNEWKYDAMNREVITELKTISIQENRTIKTRITWIFEPGLNYERMRQDATLLLSFDRNGIDSTADYYYVTREDSLLLSANGKTVIKHYPVSGSSLMK